MRLLLPLVTLGCAIAPTSSFRAPDPLPPNLMPKIIGENQKSRHLLTNIKTISGKERALNTCMNIRAAHIQWFFRRATASLHNINWNNITQTIDARLLTELTDAELRYPVYYDKVLVHGMSPLSREQAQAEAPTMDALSIVLAGRVSLYDLSMQILLDQDFTKALHPEALRIMDIGCGTGGLSRKLFSAHSNQIQHFYGVDASPYKLAKFFQATPEADRSRLSLLHMLGENLHNVKDNSMDRVVISFLFHELPQGVCRKIIKEAWRVLKPNGSLHIIDMDNQNPRIQNLASTNIDNWLIEPYMDSFLKMDFQTTLARLNFTHVNIVALDETPIAGIYARKPSSTKPI